MFLVKREESRNFDVFLGVLFLFVFGVWKREKRVEKLGREQKIRKISLWSGACVGLFIAPGMNFEAAALQRPSKSVDLGTSRKILAS